MGLPGPAVSHVLPLLGGALDGGVDGEQQDAQQQPVEHAQDRGATVVRVLLGPWGWNLRAHV